MSDVREVSADAIPYISLNDLLENYDLTVEGEHILAVRYGQEGKQLGLAPDRTDVDYVEVAGRSNYSRLARQEYNAQLRGWIGLKKYDEMRRSDSSCKQLLKLVKTPILGARWYMEPASRDKQDKDVAKFVWDCLTKYQSYSFYQMLTEILLMLDFGYYAFEKVFARTTLDTGGSKIIWKKLSPVHPLDVEEWVYDANGGPNGLWVTDDRAPTQRVFIEIDKLLCFTHEMEAGDREGVSLLRPAYKHWYYKDNLYKI